MSLKPLTAAALSAILLLGACSDDDTLSPEDRERASEAAVDAVGGGAVTNAERGDDGVAYEVEVTLPNGTELDVELDEDFTVTNDPPTADQFDQ